MNTKPVVFITGASTGIGRALALELASRGWSLALAARRAPLLAELAAEAARLGSACLPLACDVCEQAQVRQAVAAARQYFGRIDWAILSAGISQPTDAQRFAAADFAQLLQTNLLGVAYCLEELIPLLRTQGGGRIVALSSLAADRGIPGSAGYCASKAALTALFDGMRAPLQAHKIELVTVAPGYVLTPMTEKFARMPFVMQADEAAQLILRRLERGDRVIRFPLLPSIVTGLLRVLPVSLFDALALKFQPVRTTKVNREASAVNE
jgi:NAD(P)-dependent dehydrogenase (short-subunit alcohol dehydrogenase family)